MTNNFWIRNTVWMYGTHQRSAIFSLATRTQQKRKLKKFLMFWRAEISLWTAEGFSWRLYLVSSSRRPISITLIKTTGNVWFLQSYLEKLSLPYGGEWVEGHVSDHDEDAAECGDGARLPALLLPHEEAGHAQRDEDGHRVLVEFVLLLRHNPAHQHHRDHFAGLRGG